MFDIRESKFYQIARKIPFLSNDLMKSDRGLKLKEEYLKNIGFVPDRTPDKFQVVVIYVIGKKATPYVFTCEKPWESEGNIDEYFDRYLENTLDAFNEIILENPHNLGMLYMVLARIMGNLIYYITRSDKYTEEFQMRLDPFMHLMYAISPTSTLMSIRVHEVKPETEDEGPILSLMDIFALE